MIISVFYDSGRTTPGMVKLSFSSIMILWEVFLSFCPPFLELDPLSYPQGCDCLPFLYFTRFTSMRMILLFFPGFDNLKES